MECIGRNLLALSRKTGCLNSLNTPEMTVFGLINVRFRKRRDVRKAPSKIYDVREPTPKDPEEMKIMRDKYRKYKTQIGSIR